MFKFILRLAPLFFLLSTTYVHAEEPRSLAQVSSDETNEILAYLHAVEADIQAGHGVRIASRFPIERPFTMKGSLLSMATTLVGVAALFPLTLTMSYMFFNLAGLPGVTEEARDSIGLVSLFLAWHSLLFTFNGPLYRGISIGIRTNEEDLAKWRAKAESNIGDLSVPVTKQIKILSEGAEIVGRASVLKAEMAAPRNETLASLINGYRNFFQMVENNPEVFSTEKFSWKIIRTQIFKAQCIGMLRSITSAQ